MADSANHEKRYLHNKEFLSTINESLYPDWAVTVIFYCSLHKICQCLKYVYGATDEDTKSHVDTLNYLKAKNIALFQKYSMLYNQSRAARYECIDVSSYLTISKKILTDIESISQKTIQGYALSMTK